MKQRIAIFLTGGIGAGNFSQGFPKIVEIVDELKVSYDLTIYSFTTVDKGFIPEGYAIYYPPGWLKIMSLRWSFLIFSFLKNHLNKNYLGMFSFWGYPMGWLTVLLSKIIRRPAIVTILGAETAIVTGISYGHLRKQPERKRVIWTCENASALIVLTPHQIKTLREFGLKRNDIFVIPFGTKTELFQFQPKDLKEPLKIIHVANLTEVKDQTSLIKAFALLRNDTDAKLRIVGADYLDGKIQLLVNQMGLKDDIEFTGPLPYKKIPEQFYWADVCLLTSLSEGQNNSLTEAAMSGVLQVSTPVGHINDLGEELVVIVNTGDPNDISEKLKMIISNKEAWKSKVAKARKWAEEHDLNWTIAQLKKVIDTTI